MVSMAKTRNDVQEKSEMRLEIYHGLEHIRLTGLGK